MGYIFEELLRKFSEMSSETVRTVYDPTAGTGGMLTMADQWLRELNPAATVEMSGQELHPETWAIASSD